MLFDNKERKSYYPKLRFYKDLEAPCFKITVQIYNKNSIMQ